MRDRGTAAEEIITSKEHGIPFDILEDSIAYVFEKAQTESCRKNWGNVLPIG
jgi:hypothetical protein